MHVTFVRKVITYRHVVLIAPHPIRINRPEYQMVLPVCIIQQMCVRPLCQQPFSSLTLHRNPALLSECVWCQICLRFVPHDRFIASKWLLGWAEWDMSRLRVQSLPQAWCVCCCQGNGMPPGIDMCGHTNNFGPHKQKSCAEQSALAGFDDADDPTWGFLSRVSSGRTMQLFANCSVVWGGRGSERPRRHRC